MEEIRDIISKKLGFGCMRLPVIDGDTEKIDEKEFCRMIDVYLAQGFRYFDTAYPYHNQKSEAAVKRCLVDRYDREQFLLADKMPLWLAEKASDYREVFETQLKRCGVTYFDFYLLHALNRKRLIDTEQKGGFEFLVQMKQEGKAKHIGFSFHDSADVLDEILTNHPEMEFVQLQINYFDWNSEVVQSKKCYETAVKHDVLVFVMEPVKGGALANLAKEPAEILRKIDKNASFASFAVRYAASLEHTAVVLSGMSDFAQVEDNISYMKEFRPLSGEEKIAVAKAAEELEKIPVIPCTECRYCVEGCPQNIQIPNLFAAYNLAERFGDIPAAGRLYRKAVNEHGTAGDCIRCGKCEEQCPQHLEIRQYLEQVSGAFEK